MSVIGVDLGGTTIAAGRLDADLHLTASTVIATPAVTPAIITAIASLAAALAIGAPDPDSVVGLPATFDSLTGRMGGSHHTLRAGVDVAALLGARTSIPACVDNDANLAALAEHRRGAARGYDHVVMLTLGTGVGGGVIIIGRVDRGGRGHGAELGHITVDADGLRVRGHARTGVVSRRPATISSPRCARSTGAGLSRPRVAPHSGRRTSGTTPG
ncbi:MAG: ROK family protein [Thermoleophilia bacterium]|nr:ROK family protein [Thermoleophilia bacterium]